MDKPKVRPIPCPQIRVLTKMLEKVPSLEHKFFPTALAIASGPVASQAACMSSQLTVTVIY